MAKWIVTLNKNKTNKVKQWKLEKSEVIVSEKHKLGLAFMVWQYKKEHFYDIDLGNYKCIMIAYIKVKNIRKSWYLCLFCIELLTLQIYRFIYTIYVGKWPVKLQ